MFVNNRVRYNRVSLYFIFKFNLLLTIGLEGKGFVGWVGEKKWLLGVSLRIKMSPNFSTVLGALTKTYAVDSYGLLG